MTLCVCKCLNVTVTTNKIEANVDIEKLELTATEQRDIFFTQDLLSCPVNSLKTQAAQPTLTAQQKLGRWTLNVCLSCGHTTHAIIYDELNIALIPKSLLTTVERVNHLKKSNNFSPVFNLLVPEVNNDENLDMSNVIVNESAIKWPPAQCAIRTLSKQLEQSLAAQLEAIEETVQQFRDQKYAEFIAYKNKAQREHEILAMNVSKSRLKVENEGTVKAEQDGPLPAHLPQAQRRRLSSLKDTKKNPHMATKNVSYEEDPFELDDADIFLEGTDSRHDMGSDQGDYDSDDDSKEESVRKVRPRNENVQDFARSLPIDVPKFGEEPSRLRDTDFDDEEGPRDIAASIKALARSVHGDMFELPRPRCSKRF